MISMGLQAQFEMIDTLGRSEKVTKKIEKKLQKNSGNFQEKMKWILDQYSDKELFNGLALYSNPDLQDPFYYSNSELTPDRPIHIGGISRSMTALLMAQMAYEERFRWNERLGKYIDDFPYPEMTFNHLIQQQSGIVDAFKNDNFRKMVVQKEYEIDWIYRTMIQLPLEFEVGTKTKLSASSYSIMAYLLRKSSFSDYRELLNQKTSLNIENLGHYSNLMNNQDPHDTILKWEFYPANYYGPMGVVTSLSELNNYLDNFHVIYANSPDHFVFQETGYLDEKTKFSPCWNIDNGNLEFEGGPVFYLTGTSETQQFFVAILPESKENFILVSDHNSFAYWDIIELLINNR